MNDDFNTFTIIMAIIQIACYFILLFTILKISRENEQLRQQIPNQTIELDCFGKALSRMNNSNETISVVSKSEISVVSKSENGVMKVTVLIARGPASQLICNFMEETPGVEITKETKNEPR